MVTACGKKRLGVEVCKKTGVQVCGEQRPTFRYFYRRVATEKGNRESEIEERRGFEDIHRAETRRIQEANFRLVKVKPFHRRTKIQIPYGKGGKSGPPERIVDGQSRPKRRILACGSPQKIPEVSGLFMAREALSVQGNAIWPHCGTSDLCRFDEVYREVGTQERDKVNGIPGRLAGVVKF